ncbi:MAG UNVERIFIED_CONTAM: acyl-CoA dehydrogenase family protein, partial [Thermobifida fusca]
MERTLFEPAHVEFRDAVREFLRRHAVPHYARWEAEGIVDRELWRQG